MTFNFLILADSSKVSSSNCQVSQVFKKTNVTYVTFSFAGCSKLWNFVVSWFWRFSRISLYSAICRDFWLLLLFSRLEVALKVDYNSGWLQYFGLLVGTKKSLKSKKKGKQNPSKILTENELEFCIILQILDNPSPPATTCETSGGNITDIVNEKWW